MVEIKNIKALFAILWLIILIALWIMFPFMPGDILFWMWLAIGWSILGLFVFSIYVMIKAIKYVILVGFLWVVIFVLFIIDAVVSHLIIYIVPIIVAWIVVGVLLIAIITLLKKTGKTNW
jgi:hypothetical protein